MKTPAERSATYRAKDVEAYRARKNALSKTEKHRKKRMEYMRKWREANREHHNELCRQSAARNRHKHVARNREYALRKKFGIGQAEYDVMLEAQGGSCKICKTTDPGSRKHFHIDHCHTTGKIRGLLCFRCNTKLGWYETYKELVDSYLLVNHPTLRSYISNG
jgi:hypothetical protein